MRPAACGLESAVTPRTRTETARSRAKNSQLIGTKGPRSLHSVLLAERAQLSLRFRLGRKKCIPDRTPREQALDSYRRWARYPPSSRPVTDEPDQRLPHPRVGTTRPLDRNGHGEIEIRQGQDRLYLTPGETAIVNLSASKNGVIESVAVDRAELFRVDGSPRSFRGR